MTTGSVLYICGGRNFLSKRPGRKIASVVSVWRKMGYNVTHLCGGDITELGKQDTSAQQSYGAQSYHNSALRKSKYLKFFINSFSEWRDITHNNEMERIAAEHAAKNKPLVVWERSSRLHNSGIEIAKKYNLPYVLEWKDHLVPYSSSIFRRKALAMEEQKMEAANYIVVESEVLKDDLSKQHNLNADKFVVAHNAVDAAEFKLGLSTRDKVRAELGIDRGTILVGYLGSYAFYHDTIRLIKAASQFKETSIKVLMVGAGKEYAQCRDEATKRGLDENSIIFHSPVEPNDVPNILSAIDIAVLPGSTEIICPIKVQEYMAMGLPVVLPEYPCNKEIVSDGENGLLFEPFNEDKLAAAIKRLAKDSELRNRLGEVARADIERKFSWENTWGAALITAIGFK